MEVLAGEVSTITFRNEETGYSVMRVDVKGMRDPVVVVGISHAQLGEIVTVEGAWKMHAQFGRQLEASNIVADRPTEGPAIERYLASGVIKGVGPALAKRIVAEFGDGTLDVFDNEPERISRIKGIGAQRASAIVEAWKSTQGDRQVLVFLARYNIMGAVAKRLIRKYAGATIEVVEREPYRLAKEVRGIGFATADTIAQSLGMPLNAPERIVAGLRHVVTTAGGMGHCGIPRAKYLGAAAELLNLNRDLIEPHLQEQLRERDFIVMVKLDGGEFVFEKRLYDAEVSIAKGLCGMTAPPSWCVSEAEADRIAKEAEKECGVTLASEQREAVRMALLRPVSVLTGGPGTGKTSTLKVILNALRRVRARVVLGAPTGKAAKRMNESTGREASTIARLIGMGRGPDAPPPSIECSILIVDEASMLDVVMLDKVLSCLEPGAALLLVGDVDQLPSVGPGRVLGDVIDSGVIPTTRLTQVFRQAASSAIIRNAHRINRGMSIEERQPGPTDFYFVEANTPEEVSRKIAGMVSVHINKTFGIKPQEVQVLSPMRKSATGTEAMNALLQGILNPEPVASVQRNGRRYGVGDRVLQVVNNYDLGVMNGESGVIVEVDNATDTLRVDVDGSVVTYPFSDLDQLDLANAMTVHKSQGSQFPAVVIPVTTQHFVMLQRAIIYTGITRATKLCVLVGQRSALETAIRNQRAAPRITSLQSLLEARSQRVW